MESVIPCEPNGSRDSLLSPTDSQQAVDYRDFCYNNVQELLLWILLDADYGDDFLIPGRVLSILDEEMLDWGRGFSGQLGRKPRRISKYFDWNVSEHKVFSLSYALVLFHGHLPDECLDGLAMFAEIVDISCGPVVRRADIARPQSVAVKFVDHYERYYFKFQPDHVNICRSTIHCVLHLAECLKRFGPLQNVSKHRMERFIGWLVERLNARNLAAGAMLNTSIFGEAGKSFFSCMFYQDDGGYEIVASMGDIYMLGPSRRIRVSGQDQGSVSMKQMR